MVNFSKTELLHSAMDERAIFGSITGSRLRGLHHEGSDYDYTIIVESSKKINTHSASDTVDIRFIDLETFVKQLTIKPSHSDLDLLYSQEKVYGDRKDLTSVLEAITPNTRLVREVFFRTGKKLLDHKEPKRVTLSTYVASKFNEFLYEGSYNPTLSSKEKERLQELTRNIVELESYEEKLMLFEHMFAMRHTDGESYFGRA